MTTTEPEPASIFALLSTRARTHGAKTALIFEGRSFTYADLERATLSLAGGLAAAGIGRGDKIAIMMSNRPEFLFSWFAISALGAVEVPINTAHRGDLLQHMLSLAECKALIMEAQFAEGVGAIRGALPALASVITLDETPGGALGARVLRLEDLLMHAPATELPDVRPGDPGSVMFTSGTTGPSKGAVLPQVYPMRLGEIVATASGYRDDDCLYCALPLFHGNAQFLATTPTLLVGMTMVLAKRFSASAFWPDVRKYGCTLFNYIGGILPILAKAPPSPEDATSNMRIMMGAGAPRDLFTPFEQRFGVQLIEGYGMSEIGVPLMTTPDQRRPGACGRLVPDYEIRLVDEEGNEVPADEPGELWIRPRKLHSMMSEYCNMPAATVEAWKELWFHTGDYLKRDADDFYYFIDRKKDALRRRGEKISSFEVERGVAAHESVLEAAAVAVASELGEDDVMVCVTLRPGATLDPADLITHCQSRMAAFMVPRYIRILPELPKTPTERVRKVELRKQGVTPDTYDRESSAKR